MNENVRQLLRKSGLDVYGLGLDRAKWDAAVERFAEGIVEECAAIADNRPSVLMNQTTGGLIKEHFGVNNE